MNDVNVERFQRIIGSFHRRITTPHVLAEVFKLREYATLLMIHGFSSLTPDKFAFLMLYCRVNLQRFTSRPG